MASSTIEGKVVEGTVNPFWSTNHLSEERTTPLKLKRSKAVLRQMAQQQTGELIKLIEQRQLSRVEINNAAEFLGQFSDCALQTLLNLLWDNDPIIREGGIFGCQKLYERGLHKAEVLSAIHELVARESVESVLWVAEDLLD